MGVIVRFIVCMPHGGVIIRHTFLMVLIKKNINHKSISGPLTPTLCIHAIIQ